MKNPFRLASAYALTAIVFLQHLSIAADDVKPAEPTKITLHPAAEPMPALKYRLLPGRLQQKRGNAAVHYGKVTAEEKVFFNDKDLWKNIVAWHSTPLAELRAGKVHLPSKSGIEDSLRRGALCMECDWQLPIGDVPFYPMLLPEVQQTRDFGRILAARARIQIADGQYDDAITTLQTGYALGRHVATQETLVSGLVGNVICELMSQQVLALVQQPDAPNLYVALTMLPTSMIDARRALDVEQMGVELTFPELQDLRNSHRTDDEWRELFHRFAKEVVVWTRVGDEQVKLPPVEALDEACQNLARTERGMLIDEGMPAKDVQAMSVHQLALLQTLRVHHELLDYGMKCYALPFPRAVAGIDAAIARAKEARASGRAVIDITSGTLGAMKTARSAFIRGDRQIAALRVLEAFRLYAANHDGNLPQSLDEVADVPIPVDPVTERPFEYRLEDGKAYLNGTALRDIPLNYEIEMSVASTTPAVDTKTKP